MGSVVFLYIVFLLTMFLTLLFSNRYISFQQTQTNRRLVWKSNIGSEYYSILLGYYIILVLICINKPETIADNDIYMQFYEHPSWAEESVEYSFNLLAAFSPTFTILLLLYSLLSVGIKLFAIRKLSANIWLSLLCYLSWVFIVHDMIQIRAAVAIGICLFSIKYILERNWKLYLLCMLIATFFHNSAILFIPMFFLRSKNINKWVYCFLLICLVIFSNVRLGMLMQYIPIEIVQQYAAYVDAADSDITVGPLIYLRVIISLICIMRIKQIQQYYPYAIIVIQIYVISSVSFMIFKDVPVMAARISELYGVVEIFVMSMFPLAFYKYKRIMILVPVVYSVSMIVVKSYLFTDL